MALGYCYTDRDTDAGFNSVPLFTEAGHHTGLHGKWFRPSTACSCLYFSFFPLVSSDTIVNKTRLHDSTIFNFQILHILKPKIVPHIAFFPPTTTLAAVLTAVYNLT